MNKMNSYSFQHYDIKSDDGRISIGGEYLLKHYLEFENLRHQLYEINDDPKRKEFLDDLFSFMQKRGTPINRLPIMAKSVLDLYELYNLVIARGGLVDVINKKLWQEIIKGLHLPSSITSAAFTLRTQYMKYLYPYECEKKNLSSPAELQAAIDGNRREGRRSSYGQFEAMHSQLQMPQMQRPNVNSSMSQMSPLALVTHANQQTAVAAAAAAAHHRLMAPPLGQMPNIVTHELEQRMMEYFKLFQQKDARRSQSPEITPREKALTALENLEMSRVALWSMYHNNTSPPSSVNASPVEPQREALNLSDSPPNVPMKRERENSEPPHADREEFSEPPPIKKTNSSDLHNNLTIQQQQQQQLISNQQRQQQHQQQQLLHQQLQHHQDNQQNNNHQRHKSRNDDNNFDDEDDSNMERNHDIDLDDSDDIRMHPSNLVDTTLCSNDDHHQNRHHLNGHINTTIQRKSPSSSPIKSLHNGHHNDDFSLVSGMQFKITRKGTGANGEQQLVVNLDLNGTQYEGILFANSSSPLPSITTQTPVSTPSTSLVAASPTKLTTNNHNNNKGATATAAAITTNSTLLIPSSPSATTNNNKGETNSMNVEVNLSDRSMETTTEDVLNGESNKNNVTATTIASANLNVNGNNNTEGSGGGGGGKDSIKQMAQTTSLDDRLHAIAQVN